MAEACNKCDSYIQEDPVTDETGGAMCVFYGNPLAKVLPNWNFQSLSNIPEIISLRISTDSKIFGGNKNKPRSLSTLFYLHEELQMFSQKPFLNSSVEVGWRNAGEKEKQFCACTHRPKPGFMLMKAGCWNKAVFHVKSQSEGGRSCRQKTEFKIILWTVTLLHRRLN